MFRLQVRVVCVCVGGGNAILLIVGAFNVLVFYVFIILILVWLPCLDLLLCNLFVWFLVFWFGLD